MMTRLVSALAVAGCLVVSAPITTLAQGLPGLTIFSGVERENQLGFRLDYNGRPDHWDRYRLRIPKRLMLAPVSEFTVTYPEIYNGEFDDDNIRLRVNGDDVAVDEIIWDREAREIQIYPVDVVPPDSRVEIVLSNVRNPRNGGTYYFNALIRSPEDVPLRRYVGTWIISIGRS